jgi:hypothetical protein
MSPFYCHCEERNNPNPLSLRLSLGDVFHDDFFIQIKSTYADLICKKLIPKKN